MASDTQTLEEMSGDWLRRIQGAPDLSSLESERVAALGKQGAVTALLKSLGEMTPEQRQAEGPRIHAFREAVTDAIGVRKAGLEAAELERKLATETLDMTLPVSPGDQGLAALARVTYVLQVNVDSHGWLSPRRGGCGAASCRGRRLRRRVSRRCGRGLRGR